MPAAARTAALLLGRRVGIIESVSAIEREDIVTIMVSLMTLHAKADRILMYLGDEDDEEEEEA